MAYRRRQGITRASTFKEEVHHPPDDDDDKSSNLLFSSSHSFSSSSPTNSLAAQAIRASAARRDTSALGKDRDRDLDASRSKGFNAYECSTRNDSKGFWGVLARKAKAILEDDITLQQSEMAGSGRARSQMLDASAGAQDQQQPSQSNESFRSMDNPTIRKGLDKLTSSLNQIGDTFEKAFEEGRTIVENKTADIIQETRKLQMRRKGSDVDLQNQALGVNSAWEQPKAQPTQPLNQTNHENQLKASRDVAMATAAKAKLLLRELKTVKADLAFAKERCAQLEEENKILRESREKGGNPADDDLIRLQLETLLAEKARLAHDNSVYARENRFLREIVEYHQLTMQDVVYLDEGAEEVTEVFPITFPSVDMFSASPPSPKSPPSPSSDLPPSASPPPALLTKEVFSVPISPEPVSEDVSRSDVQSSNEKVAERPSPSPA